MNFQSILLTLADSEAVCRLCEDKFISKEKKNASTFHPLTCDSLFCLSKIAAHRFTVSPSYYCQTKRKLRGCVLEGGKGQIKE